MKRNGVYSGSAFVENNTIYYFYTGNVKLTDRNGYDYIHEGREQNTICCKSEDGFSIDKKELIMSNKHYPSNISKHVRDPKIIKKDENYYLILVLNGTLYENTFVILYSTCILTIIVTVTLFDIISSNIL